MRKRQIIILLIANLIPVSCMEKEVAPEQQKSICDQAKDIISECVGGRVYISSCGRNEDAKRIISAKDCDEVLTLLKGG